MSRTRIRIVGSDKRRTVLGGAALALYELERRALAQENVPAAMLAESPGKPTPAS
jgi:hypothetical protein